MAFQPHWIVGKTVASVDLNPFPDGRGGVSTSPVIRFTDGSKIMFQTQETESLDYGTKVLYHPPRRTT